MLKTLGPLLLAVIMLGGCTSQLQVAEKTMTDYLPPQKNLSFRGLQAYPDQVTCGEWDGKSPFGEFNSWQPFIVRGDQVDHAPSDRDLRIFCRDNARAYYEELTGIRPISRANKTLLQVIADFRSLSLALARYEDDNFFFPTSDQTLAALLTPAGTHPRPRNFRGPYLRAVPEDPWGRPYRYTSEHSGAVRGVFQLQTLGADGVAGGEGEDADIDSGQLPYLKHFLGLE